MKLNAVAVEQKIHSRKSNASVGVVSVAAGFVLAVLLSGSGGVVSVRRFGESFTNTVGELIPGEAVALYIPPDINPKTERLSVNW